MDRIHLLGSIVTLIVFLATVSQSGAATVTWDGDDASNNYWSTGGNWTGGSAPGSGDTALFNATDLQSGTGTINSIVSANTTVSSVLIQHTTSSGMSHNFEVASGYALTVSGEFKESPYSAGQNMVVSLRGTLTAGTINIGQFSGTGDNTWGWANLRFSGTTTLNSDNIRLGYGGVLGDNADVQMVGDGSGSTVTIRGTSGGDSRADLWISYHYANHGRGDLNFEEATVDAKIDDLIMNWFDRNNSGLGNYANLTMKSGTIDANTVLMTRFEVKDQAVTSTITINGGLFRATTINLVEGSTQTPVDSTFGSATIVLSGGTLEATTIQGGYRSSSLTNAYERKITFNSGTIRHKDGADLTISDLTSFDIAGADASHVFEATSGRTITVNSAMSGTGGITKTGAGTLLLKATNTYSGKTTVSGGTLEVDGSLANNDKDKIFIALGSSNLLKRAVASSGSYADWGSTATGGLDTTARIRSGTASAAGDLSMSWRARDSSDVSQGVVSDVLAVSVPSSSDTFVLQLSYDAADLSGIPESSLTLGWLDSGVWEDAVLGNSSGTPTFVAGAWNSGYGLGTYGVDATNDVVWAVLNNGGSTREFAVYGVIPEPASLALLGLAGLALLPRRRKP